MNSKRSTTVCGGKQFIQEYTVEDGDSLEVRVLGPISKSDGTPAQFLLQYEGIFHHEHSSSKGPGVLWPQISM